MSICRMLFQWASAIKIQLIMLSSTKWTSSLSSWKLTCSHHDKAEKVLSWHKTTLTHSLDSTRKNIGFILNSLWPTYLMLSCSNFLMPDQNPNKGNCFNWPTGPTGVEWRVLECDQPWIVGVLKFAEICFLMVKVLKLMTKLVIYWCVSFFFQNSSFSLWVQQGTQ